MPRGRKSAQHPSNNNAAPVAPVVPSPYVPEYAEHIYRTMKAVCESKPDKVCRFQDLMEKLGEDADYGLVRAYIKVPLADRVKGRQGVGYYLAGQEPVRYEPAAEWYSSLKRILDTAFAKNPEVKGISPEILIYQFGLSTLGGSKEDLNAVKETALWVQDACKYNDVISATYHWWRGEVQPGKKEQKE
jgi:hypothetical protein